MTATFARPACALVCAVALLFGFAAAAHADVAPAAVQNLESDAPAWTSEITTDIDWDDPADASSIGATLYTVDGSPVQTDPGDNEQLELSDLPDGIHDVSVWLEGDAGSQDPSTAQQVAVYIDNSPPQIGAASDIDYDADTISFPVSDALSGVDPDSVDVEASNADGSDDEDLGGEVDNGQIVADLPDYADSGNRWTFAVSAADLAVNSVTTVFNVTLNPPAGSSISGGSGGPGSGGPRGSGGRNAPGSKAKLTVTVTGHHVHGHVPTSDQAMAFTVFQLHGTRLKVLKTGRTAKSGSFNLQFGTRISGNFEVRSGRYQARFTIKKANKPKHERPGVSAAAP